MKYLIEKMSTNQEDNFIINKETVERGMVVSSTINNKEQHHNNSERNRNIILRWEYSHFKDFSKPIETPDDIKVATITYIQH